MRWPVTRTVLLLLCLMYFITYLDRVNVSTAAAGYGKQFALSSTEVGLVFSAFAYPYLVFQIVGGWISDRWGTRPTLIACGLIWAAATAASGLANGLTALLLARLMLGLGEGATFPAATAAMSRWVPETDRGSAQGLTHASARIGNAVAPMAVALVMTHYGWRVSFYVCAAISLAWVVAWGASFTEAPQNHPRITPQELAVLPPPAGPARNVAWLPLCKRMLPVALVYFCYGWTLWLFLSWIPQYFLRSYRLDLTHSAAFASGVFFAGVVGDTLGGIVTDTLLRRTGNRKLARSWMVSSCMLLAMLALLPLLITHSLGVSVASLSAGFFFAEMTIGPMWAIPMDIAPHASGTASGIMNTGSALAAVVSPVVSGYLIDRFGNWTLPFIGSMLLMALGMMLALRMHPERRFTEVSG